MKRIPGHRLVPAAVVALLCSLVFPILTVLPEPAPPRSPILIQSIRVIDPDEGLLPHKLDVYIQSGLIRQVLPAPSDPPASGYRIVDGSAKFLIPGLWDMHVHTLERRTMARFSLDLFVVNGVTGVRDMSGDCENAAHWNSLCLSDNRKLRLAIERGDVVGPRLLALSSVAVDGPANRPAGYDGNGLDYYPESSADGRQLASALSARGVDLIKTYDGMTRDAYIALLAEADRLKIEVSGHVPNAISIPEAVAAGQRTIEHARDLPYDCSTYGSIYRKEMDRVARRLPQSSPPPRAELIRRTLDTYDPDICSAVLNKMAAAGTYYVPTHLTRQFDVLAKTHEYLADPRIQYVDPWVYSEHWAPDIANYKDRDEQMFELYRRFHAHGLKLTGLAHDAGVRIVAGTDANDTHIFAGSSLHDELALLVDAGLSPLEAMQTATTVPAEYLGLSERHGSISPGKAADLVILNANPLEDIRHTANIDTVILEGRLYDRELLDELNDRARQRTGRFRSKLLWLSAYLEWMLD